MYWLDPGFCVHFLAPFWALHNYSRYSDCYQEEDNDISLASFVPGPESPHAKTLSLQLSFPLMSFEFADFSDKNITF